MFDLNYKIAADTELMMRFLEVNAIRAVYIPKTLVMMRMGGTTNRSLTNIFKQNMEILAALKQHKMPTSFIKLFSEKLVARGRQFIVRPKY
jgi:spore maturation protein SpmA